MTRNTKQEVNPLYEGREALRLDQTPCGSFHVRNVQGHGLMYLGTNHWLSVGMAGAESEAGVQDAGHTTESQARKTG